MPVEVIPTVIRREEDGFVKGKVTYVSVAPATVEGITRVLKNKQLAQKLSNGAAPFEVRVELQADPSTPSRLAWSTSRGPNVAVTSGTPTRAEIIWRAEPVLGLIVPATKPVSRLVAADPRSYPSEHRAVSGAAISWLPRRRVRVPTILQLEAAECGAACLAMVLAAHGRWTPLAELREACGVGRDGVKASNILVAAREAGLLAKGVRVQLDDVAAIACPFVAFWNFNHFVVVEQYRAKAAAADAPGSTTRTAARARSAARSSPRLSPALC